ncbi:MAG: protein translocase subunit SecF [Haloarculaceae archaeon]
MVEYAVPEIDYSRYSNRQLAAVPLAVLGLAILIIAATWATAGVPVALGTDFTSGSVMTVQTDMSKSEIRSSFDQEIVSVQGVQAAENQYVVTFESSDIDSIREAASNIGAIEVLGSSSTPATFTEENQRLTLIGLAVAFLGMSILAFILFRTFVPSIAIVISAFSDIVIPIALMNLFGMKLSLGIVAALLMLIGYSVDSDILLNNHILRRSGDFYESTYRAMQTGVSMTVTSIAAMIVMAVLATFFGIDLMASIGLVLVFGLSADLMNTYLLNLSLLRWYKFEGVAR